MVVFLPVQAQADLSRARTRRQSNKVGASGSKEIIRAASRKAFHVLRIWLSVLLLLSVLGVFAWAADFVTLQGERTVYTANCQQGTWSGTRCSGTLVAGDRYRFRALKAHGEVLFWTVGAKGEPSGKFSDCVIRDGRNWACKASAETARAIAREMALGKPVPDAAGLTKPFHPIPKWRWMLMQWGITLGNEATD
jgi:hypothetical protein